MKKFSSGPGPGCRPMLPVIFFLLGGVLAGFAAEPSAPALPLTGTNLARENGGWLNVAVKSSRFVISFFNARKEPVPADVQDGMARYSRVTLPGRRVPLDRSADGRTLVSPREVHPPLEFRVNLALFSESPDTLPETYAFFYHG